jgi:hypothetical protein
MKDEVKNIWNANAEFWDGNHPTRRTCLVGASIRIYICN